MFDLLFKVDQNSMILSREWFFLIVVVTDYLTVKVSCPRSGEYVVVKGSNSYGNDQYHLTYGYST